VDFARRLPDNRGPTEDAMTPEDRDAYLAFFSAAAALKDTLRSGHTPGGRPESTAEHTWRLCLMAVALDEELGVDLRRLLELLVVHDLGEAIRGDVPAPLQAGDKTAEERADFAALAAKLPAAAGARLLARWDEYNAVATPEARLAKGLDRLETVLTHAEGANPSDFDYAFNLGYGRGHTDGHPVVAALREPVDAQTARRAERKEGRLPAAGST
jgi:putative hydrolase of HD superfamily